MDTAIRTFVVEVVPDRSLTERGYERLDEAIDAADLPTALHDAVVDALGLEGRQETNPEHVIQNDWYTVAVAEPPQPIVYTLAEIKNGTGWEPGVRFIEYTAGGPLAPR